MSESKNVVIPEIDPNMRIVGLNTEKTRLDLGSKTLYHVYFEMSGNPLPEWRRIFEQEWKKASPGEGADIDGGYLVLHCELQQVAATLLPKLKAAVASANEEYKHYMHKESTARKHREDAWKHERKDVEDLAASLRFD